MPRLSNTPTKHDAASLHNNGDSGREQLLLFSWCKLWMCKSKRVCVRSTVNLAVQLGSAACVDDATTFADQDESSWSYVHAE
jgi:hypothetical protein